MNGEWEEVYKKLIFSRYKDIIFFSYDFRVYVIFRVLQF